MKLSIERETLLEPLQTVIGVVERRQTLPILANVLLAITDTQLSITATDTEIELIANATVAPLPHQVEFTVSGRKLLDILRALPENATIDLQQDKERLIVRSGRSRFTLATLPVEGFPRFGAATPMLTLSLTQKDLADLLQRCYFSMAHQDIRHYLNGMLIDVKDEKIRTVATDGHRFAMTGKAIDANNKMAQVILPRKGVLELLRLLKQDNTDLNVEIGQSHMRVVSEKLVFTSKLIDGRFPGYESALPKGVGNAVLINREAFKNALIRVSILSNEKFRVVRLHLCSGFLHILANNPEQEEAEEILSVDYSAEELNVAFNVSFLLDILNTVQTETIKLTFIDASGRMSIEETDNTDSIFLVMPMQL